MQKFHTDPLGQGIAYPVIGINSLDLAVADAVYIDTNGWLALATTSSKIFGFSTDNIDALESDNQTVDFVKPSVVPAMAVLMKYGSDQDCTQTDIGAYADFGTTTTNAFEVNLTAGGTGQLFVLGFDPDDEDDDDAIIVEVAEPQRLAFAQS